jgi:hypothetical protein
MGPRASVDDVEKEKILTLPGLELQPLGHPARSQSLYRQGSPGSYNVNNYRLKSTQGSEADICHQKQNK